MSAEEGQEAVATKPNLGDPEIGFKQDPELTPHQEELQKAAEYLKTTITSHQDEMKGVDPTKVSELVDTIYAADYLLREEDIKELPTKDLIKAVLDWKKIKLNAAFPFAKSDHGLYLAHIAIINVMSNIFTAEISKKQVAEIEPKLAIIEFEKEVTRRPAEIKDGNMEEILEMIRQSYGQKYINLRDELLKMTDYDSAMKRLQAWREAQDSGIVEKYGEGTEGFASAKSIVSVMVTILTEKILNPLLEKKLAAQKS